jgi:hypothetical protein
VGQLNYVITRMIASFIGEPSYTQINAVIGVLECVKLELYRRLAASYEDVKCYKNGDIPEYERGQAYVTPTPRAAQAATDTTKDTDASRTRPDPEGPHP